MTDHEHGKDTERREPDLSVLGEDVAHPFDQTNGIVEGLEGDADDPEQADKRTDPDAAGAEVRDAGIPGDATDNADVAGASAANADSEDETRP